MSAFGDLFRLFPGKVAELSLDEAFINRRPLYYFDELSSLPEQVPHCEVCGRVAVFHWRDDRYDAYNYNPPLPDLTQDCCENPQCVTLYNWFLLKGYEGNKRRRAFKEKFGVYWVNGEGTDEKAARLALVMLEFTIREKTNAENGRRVA